MNFEKLLDKLLSHATDLAFRLLGALAILIIGRLLIKWVMRLIRRGKSIKKLNPAVERFLINSIRVVLNVVLVVSVIAVLGVPMTSVLALLTSAGVAIGLALQGALSNLAGGIMILIFHPFHLDDYVEIENFSGTVKDIGFFYTTLCTTDNRVVTIPNGTVMGEEIINYSSNPTRRVDMLFSVAYGTDIDRVRLLLLEEADKHPMTLKEPEPFCRLSQQNSSSLDFTLRVWVNKDDYWTVKFDLLEAIQKRMNEEHITVPFNQLDVHISNEKDLQA
ncbi:MAG: mechanosensitive ion channel [Clostridia bacterium]|nr:mechanosensitive ion channel [Clostridia bacterium]